MAGLFEDSGIVYRDAGMGRVLREDITDFHTWRHEHSGVLDVHGIHTPCILPEYPQEHSTMMVHKKQQTLLFAPPMHLEPYTHFRTCFPPAVLDETVIGDALSHSHEGCEIETRWTRKNTGHFHGNAFTTVGKSCEFKVFLYADTTSAQTIVEYQLRHGDRAFSAQWYRVWTDRLLKLGVDMNISGMHHFLNESQRHTVEQTPFVIKENLNDASALSSTTSCENAVTTDNNIKNTLAALHDMISSPYQDISHIGAHALNEWAADVSISRTITRNTTTHFTESMRMSAHHLISRNDSECGRLGKLLLVRAKCL